MEALSTGAVCAPLFLVSLSSLPKPLPPLWRERTPVPWPPGHGPAGLPHVFSSRESRLHPGGPQGPEKSPDQGSEASAAPTSFASLQPRGRGEDVASASAEPAGGCPPPPVPWSGWSGADGGTGQHRRRGQDCPQGLLSMSFHSYPLWPGPSHRGHTWKKDSRVDPRGHQAAPLVMGIPWVFRQRAWHLLSCSCGGVTK